MNASSQVLVVDDQPANLEVLTTLLADQGWKVRAVTSGQRALDSARLQAPDCILLDVAMPGMDGYATCRAFNADPELAHIPIIFITAFDSPDHRVRAFEEGGRDYITKPFQSAEVIARVGRQLRLSALEHDLRQQNQLLTAQNAQLEEVSALKERATAMLVHDVRGPLMIIGAALDAPSDAETMRDAREALTKTTRLLSELLEVYRTSHTRNEVSRQMVDVREVATGVINGYRHVARERGVELVLAPGAALLVHVAQSQIDRVVSNLVDNAIKHTASGGRVVLATEVEAGRGPEQGLNFGVLSVTDTGSGIPPSDLAFIFDFYRQRPESREHGGVGLGLSIVQRLVAAHGGRVHVRSQVGVGTEFRVLLPH